MVVDAHYHCPFNHWGTDCHWGKFRSGTVYLYFILKFIHDMSRKKDLETILTLCVALTIFFLILQINALLIASIILGLIGIFSHYLTGKIAWAWLKMAEGLGFIMSKILLTVVFILLLCPLAFIARLFTQDKLQLKKSDKGSYYVTRNHQFLPKDLENMW